MYLVLFLVVICFPVDCFSFLNLYLEEIYEKLQKWLRKEYAL